ncbi:MAG: hypothetical protein HC842_03310 [Cytophagales bacterium]|nr:hypothetical protein [Cytophagales bacterium]
MKHLALSISVLLHPLLVPSYLCLICMGVVPEVLHPISSQSFFQLWFFIFLTSFLLPLTCISLLRTLGWIQSWQLHLRQERTLPYLFSFLIYAATAGMLHFRLKTSPTLALGMASIAMVILAVGLVNLFWKISAHGAALGGALGFLLALSHTYHAQVLYPVVGCCLLFGVVAWARLWLREHQPAQVYWGGLLGVAIAWSVLFLLGNRI